MKLIVHYLGCLFNDELFILKDCKEVIARQELDVLNTSYAPFVKCLAKSLMDANIIVIGKGQGGKVKRRFKREKGINNESSF